MKEEENEKIIKNQRKKGKMIDAIKRKEKEGEWERECYITHLT